MTFNSCIVTGPRSPERDHSPNIEISRLISDADKMNFVKDSPINTLPVIIRNAVGRQVCCFYFNGILSVLQQRTDLTRVCLSLFHSVTPEYSGFQIGPEIKTGLCRLIIRHILRSNADTINGIFEKSMETIIGRNTGYIQSE